MEIKLTTHLCTKIRVKGASPSFELTRLITTFSVGKIIGEVLDWLAAPDPSSNQRNIDKKREPDTGLWFVNGAQFNKWKAAAGSFLWLHGIRKHYILGDCFSS